MNILKKLLLASLLGLAAVTSAQAVVVYRSDLDFTPDPGAPGVSQLTWTRSSTDLDSQGALLAGDEFVDYYFIDVPDTEFVSFTASGSTAGFLAWAVLDPANSTLLYLNYPSDPFSLSSGVFTLDSGVYAIALDGIALEDGGSYGVTIVGAPVPEPGAWALMLAGFGAVGALARRRRQQA